MDKKIGHKMYYVTGASAISSVPNERDFKDEFS